jgi:3-oxoacyl-[acyl-carrier protein] reductase
MRRRGSAEEVADAIVFLCSPRSDYVHGQVLTVSGGFAAGMER